MGKPQFVRVLKRLPGRRVLVEEFFAEHPNDRSFVMDYGEVLTALQTKYKDNFKITWAWRRLKVQGWILKRIKPVEVEC